MARMVSERKKTFCTFVYFYGCVPLVCTMKDCDNNTTHKAQRTMIVFIGFQKKGKKNWIFRKPRDKAALNLVLPFLAHILRKT